MALVVVSQLKKVVKELGCQCASDFPDALDKKVEELIKTACEKAKADKRKTVRPGDL